MPDLWEIRSYYCKYFTKEENAIIDSFKLDGLFVDLYDFYTYEYGAECMIYYQLHDKFDRIRKIINMKDLIVYDSQNNVLFVKDGKGDKQK